ncbi:MAG: hypothetical protein WCJ30_06940 [Deltaproteobacteria bacterium]
MDAAGQQFVQGWYQFLQQNTVQVQALLQEADGSCQQILGSGSPDPLAIQNALNGVGQRIKELQARIGTTWSEQILAQLMGSRDNREPIEQGLQHWDSASRWIQESWERMRCHWMAEGLRHLWPHVQQEMAAPHACSRCGAAIQPATRHRVDSVTCAGCGNVNTTEPGPKTGLFYSMGPDAWAEAATLDLRLEIDQFRRQAEAQARMRQALQGERGEEPVESLERWEAMERDYWMRYFAEKAHLLPSSPDEQKQMVESKLKSVQDEIKQSSAYRSAKGTAQKIGPVVIPRELENVDEWGPLRPEQYEDFEFHQFLLEESRGEPEQFNDWLRQLGYRDVMQYELMRRTFSRHYAQYVGDPRMGQAQMNARQRASQAQMSQKRAASGDILAPIEGVSLEQYAQTSARQASGMSQQDFARFLGSQGMDPAKWDRVSNEWLGRMSRDTSGVISSAYAAAFAGGAQGQYGAAAQAAAPALGQMAGMGTLGGMGGPPGGGGPGGAPGGEPVPFERFCEIMGAQTAWSRTGRDVNAMLRQVFNMSAADWSNISAYWMSRIPTDMNLAMQMTPLSQKYEQRYMQM